MYVLPLFVAPYAIRAIFLFDFNNDSFSLTVLENIVLFETFYSYIASILKVLHLPPQ